MQHVAQRRPRTRDQYDRWLRETEMQTIAALKSGNNETTTGIIGRERGKDLRQTPTVVYWNALEKWGIRTTHLRRAAVRDLVVEQHGSAAPPIWSPMPAPPTGFPDEPLSILPTVEEGTYLLEKMGATRIASLNSGEADHPSLLAWIARQSALAEAAQLPWDIDDPQLPQPLREQLHMAEGFSLIIHGAQLLYLDLLYRAKSDQEHGAIDEIPNYDRLADLRTAWIDEMDRRTAFASAWLERLPEMFGYLRAPDPD